MRAETAAAGRKAGVIIAVLAIAAAGAALVLGRPDDSGAGTLESSSSGTEARLDGDQDHADPGRPPTSTTGSRLSSPPYTAPTPAEVALLPEARFDAVVPGLLEAGGPVTAASAGPTTVYSLLSDAPLYGADRTTPIARLAAVNFLGEPTVVVPLRTEREWTLVLTPARQSLPSSAGGAAAAQTAGWMRADALAHPRTITDRVVVSVSEQSLAVMSDDEVIQSFDVGVGTPGTPTPHGVTGYLQARYLDPAQGQSEHRLQLTSLHSSAADEPYGGADGGLIGIHYSEAARGSVSHGCIRLSGDAIRAVDALPLGTSIAVLE